ncbi:hypothetical protein FHS81_003172 [Pseudochelatococcus contaminans]|uniref:Uncharacterized protein n=1 Tax=Pseudochelatococcus contaminans TaxID=1538103 RepID=A0A7W5Z6F5_9HYPH|nr:hypothetical protein [Pseudochelatococcus contaminans]
MRIADHAMLVHNQLALAGLQSQTCNHLSAYARMIVYASGAIRVTWPIFLPGRAAPLP